jgi:hypothetical protein
MVPSTQSPIDDRRKAKRQRAFKSAKIAFGQGAAIDCMVRNESSDGACLEVASPIGVPSTFDLVLDRDHSKRSCRVIWISERKIGVAFIG